MTGAISSSNALSAFLALEKNRDLYFKRFKDSAQVKKDIEYFQKKVGQIKTVDDFVKDPKLLALAATAFGLEADLKYPARLKKVLTESVGKDDSLANKLIDPRYKEMAKFFAFGDVGLTKVKLSFTQKELVDKYTTAAFEKAQAQTNPALRDALYFERKIGNVQNGYDILGDNVLRAVVTYTLDLPPQIAIQSVEKQKALIEQKLDIKKFQNTNAATASRAITDATADLTKLDPVSQALDAAQAKVTEIVDRLQALRVEYDRLTVTQNPAGPYAAEIPTQQAAIEGLARQNGLIGSASQATDALTTLYSTLNSYIIEAQDPTTTGARLTELKGLYAQAVTDASQLVSDATYGGENLLDGSLSGTISVTVATNGQGTTLRTHDVNNGVLDNLAAANTAFQADNFSGAQTSQDAADTALAEVRLQISQDTQIFNSVTGAVNWVPTLDTSNVYTAQQVVTEAQNATGEASGLIGQIKALAQEATDGSLSAAERTALNDEYIILRDQLRDTLANGGYGGYSLLDGSTVSIGGGAGANEVVLDANGAIASIGGRDLVRFADDTAPPAESLYNLDLTSAASAQSVVDSIETQIEPEITRTFRTLATYRGVFDLEAETLDPRGKLDAQYRELADELDALIKAADAGSTNLLESTSIDMTVKSAVTGGTFTAHAQSTFRSLVETTLSNGAGLLLSNFTQARQALDDTAFYARRFQSNIKTDQTVLTNQKAIINQAKKDAEAAQDNTKNATNEFVEKFIQRYLLKKDAEAAKALTGGGSGNSYLLNLLS